MTGPAPEKKKRKIVLVGAGVVAKKHKKAIDYLVEKQMVEWIGLVDPREEATNALLEGASIPTYKSLDECLSQGVPDLVAITTPSGTHAKLATEALEAGAHVLIEKPMTLSVQDADKLLTLAETKERKIAVGHIYRYFPLSLPLKQAIASGVFGTCLYGVVNVRWGHEQDYYDQATWRGTYAADGGALLNQSIHAIDLMQWLIDEKAIEASAMLARQRHAMEAEDLALGVIRFKNNIYLQVEGTTNTNPKRHEATFALFFEKGEVRVALDAGTIDLEIWPYDGKRQRKSYLLKSVWQKVKEEGLSILPQLSNPHTFLYVDFLRAIEEEREPLASGQTGKDAVATVLALYRAAKERQVVSVASTIAFPLSDMVGVPEATEVEDAPTDKEVSPREDEADVAEDES